LARGGVLSRAEALRGGEAVRSLVPVPLPDALLLRRPGRARCPHGARICGGWSPAARSPNPSREAAERRDLASRPDSSRRRAGKRSRDREEESEAARAGTGGGAEQV